MCKCFLVSKQRSIVVVTQVFINMYLYKNCIFGTFSVIQLTTEICPQFSLCRYSVFMDTFDYFQLTHRHPAEV